MTNTCDVCDRTNIEVIEYNLEMLLTNSTIYLCEECAEENKEN